MLTDEQKEARQGRIGSSDVGVVLGLTGGVDAEYELWLRLVHGQDLRPTTPQMLRGSLLEESLVRIASRELGVGVAAYPAPTVIGDGTFFPTWAVDHTDALFEDGSLLEAKAYSMAPPELPPHVRAQCLWHLAAHPQAPHCHVIVFSRVDDVRYFVVERNHEEIADILERVEGWYHRHVEQGIEPEWPLFVAMQHIIAKTGGASIICPGNEWVREMTREYQRLQTENRQMEERLREIRRCIAVEMARVGATGLSVPEGRWRTQNGEHPTVRFYPRSGTGMGQE